MDKSTLQFAIDVAQEAGKILMAHFGKKLTRTIKSGPNDFATEADQASEKFIIDKIQEHFPEDSIIAEESGKQEREDERYTWIIDPLDGTYNFANGKEEFGVMIARSRDGEVALAVVWCPADKALVVAEKGKGVTLNGKAVTLPTVGKPVKISISKELEGVFDSIGEEVLGFSAAGNLTEILSGGYHAAVWHAGLVWDYAPVALSLAEGGWKVTDIAGRPFRTDGPLAPGKPGIIAAAPDLHRQLVQIVCIDIVITKE